MAISAFKVPSHVPMDLLCDFDVFDPQALIEPHGRYLAVRDAAPPIFYTPKNGGHWVFTRYRDMLAALNDSVLFSSMNNRLPGSSPLFGPHRAPLDLDPPSHTVHRRLLSPFFTQRALSGLANAIRSDAVELARALMRAGGCEFVGDFAAPFAIRAFLRTLGLSLDQVGAVRELVEPDADLSVSPAPCSMIERATAYVATAIAERRADPCNDLISSLLAMRLGGSKLPADTILSIVNVLFASGIEPVISSLAHMARALALDPVAASMVRARPQLMEQAVEELLRRNAVANTLRRVTRDAVFSGVDLAREDRVLLWLTIAGLDEDEVPDACRFDLSRREKPHLAFGAGPHRCAGIHLARLELRMAIEALLEEIPHFSLDPEQPPVFRSGEILAMARLPLRLEAAA